MDIGDEFQLSVSARAPTQPLYVDKPKRIPSLDGARALSIILVVYSHLATSGTIPFADRLWRIEPGNLGVRVFFVISGFLVTPLLLNQSAGPGKKR